jgi:general secretion pathway protein A
MYREFYGFSEDPFAQSPNPRFLYLARSHFEALSSMMSGIKDRKGIIVITGEVGTGKTTVIYTVLKDLSEKIKTALVFHPGLDFKGLLKSILLELDVPMWKKQENLLYFIGEFRRYLNERLIKDEIVAVIIDEAQNLDEETLEGLGQFCNPDIPAAKVLQILLVGHPELELKLNSEKLCMLKKRINVHCRITPLTREEGRAYIEHRMKLAGRNISEIFTPEVANRVWEFAQGIPRVINFVCDRALLIGFTKSRPIINSIIVKEAMKELDYLSPGNSKPLLQMLSLKKSGYKILKIFFLLFSVLLFLFSLRKILAMILEK